MKLDSLFSSLLSLSWCSFGLGWGGGLSWGSWSLGWSGGLLGWGSWGLGWSSSLDWSLSWGSWLGGGGLGLLGSLLLLEVLGEELLVSDMSLLTSLPSVLLDLLVDSLSSNSLLGDESLNLWGLVESLVSVDEFSLDNVLSNIIDLLSEGERLDDVVGSLWSESSWSLNVGESFDLGVSLDENLKGNDGKIWSANASSA